MSETTAIDLEGLREEQEAIKLELDATAQARDARTKEYKASKRRRQQTFRDGVPVYEDSWVAEDEELEAKLVEFDATIQVGNRRSQELGRAIEERRRVLVQARNRAKAAAEVTPVAPLEAGINTARAAYESLVEELASIPAELEEAHRSADAEAIVAAQLRARDLPIHVAAARTALLNAQARHAEAMVASFVTELQAAEEALNTAAEDLAIAKERHAEALHDLRCVSGDQEQWRRKQAALMRDLDQHLNQQRVA